MKQITLTNSELVALVDDDDFARASAFKWSVMKHPKSGKVYAGSSRGSLHVFIMGKPSDGRQIDHQDGNGLNCQRSNMRLATREENARNYPVHKDNKSGYKGVHQIDPRRILSKPWKAVITIGARGRTRPIHLGTFATAEEAARAYDTKARELHGEFARLNFPG